MGRGRQVGGIVTPGESLTLGAEGETVTAEILQATHPLHRQYGPLWEKIIDLAEGENLHRYIHRHARESEEAWRQRQVRTEYRNFVDPILSLNAAYLFSKPVTREAEPDEKEDDEAATVPFSGATRLFPEEDRRKPLTGQLAEEWQHRFLYDVDRQGNSIDRFMRKVTYWSLALGCTFVVVDKPRVDRTPKTLAEQKLMGIRPYFAMYMPTNLTNWEVDQDQRFVWVRFREPITSDVGPFDPKVGDKQRLAPLEGRTLNGSLFQAQDPNRVRTPGPKRALYRTFTRDEWMLHEVNNGRVIEHDRGAHNLGRVPVVPVFNRQRARFPVIGRPEVHDIIGLNQGILNLDSLIVEAVYQQVLNILVMRRQQNQQKEIIVGPENVLTFTGDQPPFFITPSTAPLQFMEQRIQGLIGEIYRLAKFKGGQAMQIQSVPSGVAATVEFNETDRALAEKAEELQNAEFEMHDVWCRYYGVRFDGTVDYPDSFQVQPYSEELNQITQAKTAIRSDRFIRELEKRLARRMLPNVPESTQDAIDHEIDIIPPSISSFSGPVFFDPLTQQVKQPTDPSAQPIGLLGELYAQEAEDAGMAPDELNSEMGGPPSPERQLQDQQSQMQQGLQQQAASAEVAAKAPQPPAPPGAKIPQKPPAERARTHVKRQVASAKKGKAAA